MKPNAMKWCEPWDGQRKSIAPIAIMFGSKNEDFITHLHIAKDMSARRVNDNSMIWLTPSLQVTINPCVSGCCVCIWWVWIYRTTKLRLNWVLTRMMCKRWQPNCGLVWWRKKRDYPEGWSWIWWSVSGGRSQGASSSCGGQKTKGATQSPQRQSGAGHFGKGKTTHFGSHSTEWWSRS